MPLVLSVLSILCLLLVAPAALLFGVVHAPWWLGTLVLVVLAALGWRWLRGLQRSDDVFL